MAGNRTENVSASSPDETGCYLYSFVIYTVIVGFLCLFGLVSNSISFCVFYKDAVKTSTPFLFQGLSVIDNLLLITVIPLYCIEPFVLYTGLYPGYLSYGYSSIVLVYIFPLASVTQTATIWVTVLVAVNRYIAVCMPYQAPRLCTVRQAKIQLTAVLVLAVLYNVPKFAEGYVEYDPVEDCLKARHTELGDSFTFMLIYDNVLYMIFMMILPLLTLTVLNIRLVKALKELSRKRAEMQSARQQQDNNVTLVLIIVVLVFIICQAPALANKFMWSVLDNDARACGGFQFYFSRLSNVLVIVNSAVNFVIYFFFNTRFRQVLVVEMCGSCGVYKAFRLQGPATADTAASQPLPPPPAAKKSEEFAEV